MADATETNVEDLVAWRLWAHRSREWSRRVGLGAKLAIGVAIFAVLSGIATYVASTSAFFNPQPQTLEFLLRVNLVLLITLGVLVGHRLIRLWLDRRSGLAGSHLHVRLIALFSLFAITPTIIVAIFSATIFDLGLQAWFSERVRTVLDNSLSVAQAYTEENRKSIRGDLLAMANDLRRQSPVLTSNTQLLNQFVSVQTALRSLSEAIVFDSSGQVLAHANLSLGLGSERLPLSALQQAASGEIVILSNPDDDRLQAVVRLNALLDTYLYVTRYVDAQVLRHVARTEAAIAEYEQLEGARSGIQATFNFILISVALLLLFASVWFGIWLAARLVAPIRNLVEASELVRNGNLTTRVPENIGNEEMDVLSRSFNRMTHQLQSQRNELVQTNQQLDTRTQFTEAVLAGVTAGVIGLDANGTINLPNRSAVKMLGVEVGALKGRRLEKFVPEMGALVQLAHDRADRLAQGDISIESGGVTRTLHVRVSAEPREGQVRSYVVTFDDLTNLVAAERTAAWADVARRIAHEIKNPLTPIQLSAERMLRKYANEVTSDPDVFKRCIDTIVRQVAQIRHMVDEFSSFASMPAPVFSAIDLSEIAKHTVFLQELASPNTSFEVRLPAVPVIVECDGDKISQALTNLLKNAEEGIEARRAQSKARNDIKGRISIELISGDDCTAIEIRDNGIGLPENLKERLTEPYVTTRSKGTGLGLAIVNKIVEEHHGNLSIKDLPKGGVVVRIDLPNDHHLLHIDEAKKTVGGRKTITATHHHQTSKVTHGT